MENIYFRNYSFLTLNQQETLETLSQESYRRLNNLIVTEQTYSPQSANEIKQKKPGGFFIAQHDIFNMAENNEKGLKDQRRYSELHSFNYLFVC